MKRILKLYTYSAKWNSKLNYCKTSSIVVLIVW